VSRRWRRVAIALLLTAAASQTRASAHIGSPDVFVEAHAGPYRLLVTVRPPHAIPGIADVDVLTTSDDVRDVRIVPLPLTGAGAQFAPVADRAVRSADDPRLYTGHLWLMSAGAWQIRVTVAGDRGEGMLSVPVPTLPQSTLAMSNGLRAVLFVLMLLLASGFVGIVSALVREARLDPGETVDRRARRRGRVAGAIAMVAVGGIIWLGNMWWSAEASSYAQYVYKPLTMTPRVTGSSLSLDLRDPGWIGSRRLDDFIRDHGYPMHLFVLSPSLDRLWHLHPNQTTGPDGRTLFVQQVPNLPAGEFELFADLVHATGVSETATARFETPAVQGTPLAGDDSAWVEGDSTPGKVVWVRDDTPLVPKRMTLFTFRVEDADGQPAKDLELYMGMPGHAIFVKKDRRVFAHVHPSGSAPMAAMNIAMKSETAHAQHVVAPAPPSTVTFPFGFPEAGEYRIFVQVKRAGAVTTTAFDAMVR
jgi:hypothetical protein